MQKSRITHYFFILSLIGAVMLLASACSNKQKSTSSNGKVSIVASTNVYADIAKNVAGKYGDVQAVIKNSATVKTVQLIRTILSQLRQMPRI